MQRSMSLTRPLLVGSISLYVSELYGYLSWAAEIFKTFSRFYLISYLVTCQILYVSLCVQFNHVIDHSYTVRDAAQ